MKSRLGMVVTDNRVLSVKQIPGVSDIDFQPKYHDICSGVINDIQIVPFNNPFFSFLNSRVNIFYD